MSTVAAKLLTAEEFFQLSDRTDGSKEELVRGEVVAMPGPGVEHGEIQARLVFLILTYLAQHPIGRAMVESGMITERGPDTVRGPDVSYYSKERMPLDKRVVGYHDRSADLCVEVLFPSNTRKEVRTKRQEYFNAGVRMVWVVDPEDRCVTIFRSADEGKTLYNNGVIDGEDVLPGFNCKVAQLFG